MTTLAQLKTSVDSWLIRDDVAVTGADFPQILLLAESDIARDVRCVIQEKSATLNFTGRSQDLPYDFLELRRVFVDDSTRQTDYLTPEALRESSLWAEGRAGAFYTIESGSQTAGDERVAITIANAASVATPLTMNVMYWARFPALAVPTDTNWLLKNHYDIYLYATLRAAAEYIQEDALEDRYGSKYERAIEKMRLHEQRKRFGAMPKQTAGNFPRAIV